MVAKMPWERQLLEGENSIWITILLPFDLPTIKKWLVGFDEV